MQDQPIYTADQVARAARELREAAGTPQQRFTAAQVVSMLSDEVRRDRARLATNPGAPSSWLHSRR